MCASLVYLKEALLVDAVVAFQQSGAKLASIVPDSWEWGSSVVSTETADAPALTSSPDK